MSPEPVTAELTYQRLKLDVMNGRFRPGTPVVSQVIAQELGTSISPVRDAMQRLVGERLLHHQSGGGFEIPHLTARALGDLYAWHHEVVRLAIRHRDPDVRSDDLLPRLQNLESDDTAAIAQATCDLFSSLGQASRNVEHATAIEAIGSRLFLVRLHETGLSERPRELVEVWNAVFAGPASAALTALRAYHRRRMRRVSSIVRTIYVP